jgi:hypothetical protein
MLRQYMQLEVQQVPLVPQLFSAGRQTCAGAEVTLRVESVHASRCTLPESDSTLRAVCRYVHQGAGQERPTRACNQPVAQHVCGRGAHTLPGRI